LNDRPSRPTALQTAPSLSRAWCSATNRSCNRASVISGWASICTAIATRIRQPPKACAGDGPGSGLARCHRCSSDGQTSCRCRKCSHRTTPPPYKPQGHHPLMLEHGPSNLVNKPDRAYTTSQPPTTFRYRDRDSHINRKRNPIIDPTQPEGALDSPAKTGALRVILSAWVGCLARRYSAASSASLACSQAVSAAAISRSTASFF
jgi:hypothetical protein